MDKLKSPTDVKSLLAEHVKAAGGQIAWGAQHGVSPQYVCDCLKGRRAIGPLIASALGFEVVTMYAPIRNKRKKGTHQWASATRCE